MKEHIWFEIVKEWKATGRGSYGVTFPFLVGALSNISGREPTKEFIEELFDSIIQCPVDGFYGEVRWCPNINEPVISVNPLNMLEKVSIKDSFKVGNITSLAFTTDLMSMFNLDCDNSTDCKNKLINMTCNVTKDAKFSKNNGIFTYFTDDDLHFISDVSGVNIRSK